MRVLMKDTGKRCLECGGRMLKDGIQRRWLRRRNKKPRILSTQQYRCVNCGKRSVHYTEAESVESQR